MKKVLVLVTMLVSAYSFGDTKLACKLAKGVTSPSDCGPNTTAVPYLINGKNGYCWTCESAKPIDEGISASAKCKKLKKKVSKVCSKAHQKRDKKLMKKCKAGQKKLRTCK